jgi:hypothetical protein
LQRLCIQERRLLIQRTFVTGKSDQLALMRRTPRQSVDIVKSNGKGVPLGAKELAPRGRYGS